MRRLIRVLPVLLLLVIPVPALAATVPGQFPTIQAAINAVVAGSLPNGEVINVQPGTYGAVSVFNTTRSFTVRAVAGPGSTTITGGGAGPAVLVRLAPGAIRFEGFTITGGRGGPGPDVGGGVTVQDSSPTFASCVIQGNTSLSHGGGATLVRSNATFESTTFQSNSAAAFGGGLFSWLGSNPTITSSTFSGNVAGATNPNGAGGGIAIIDASAVIRSTTVSGNSGKFAGGGVYAAVGFAVPGPKLVVVEDSTIESNTASRFNAAQPPAFGGGIHIEDNVTMQLRRTTVRNNVGHSGGGLSTFRARFEVTDSFIETNQAIDPQGGPGGGLGGGIVGASAADGSPTHAIVLTGTVVRGNIAQRGGGLSSDSNAAFRANISIFSSLFDGNAVTTFGGGLYVGASNLLLASSQVIRNRADGSRGGGLALLSTVATIADTTVANNRAATEGGGLYLDLGTAITMTQSFVYQNIANTRGGGFYVGTNPRPTGTVQGNVIADNTNFQISEDACPTIVAGTAASLLGYVNNTITAAAGNVVYHSPCPQQPLMPPTQFTVSQLNNNEPSGRSSGNNGNTPAFLSFAATPSTGPRNVLAWAVARATSISIAPGIGAVAAPTGTVDVSPPCTTNYVLSAGSQGNGVATVLKPMTLSPTALNIFAFPVSFSGGVFVAAGDVNRDGTADIIVGAGAGGGPHIRVFSGVTGAELMSFFPFPVGFTGGVRVAAGDLDGDGFADVIAGAGPGGGPHVRVFSGRTGLELASFFPFPVGFTGGVHVASGDVDGDGRADVIAGADAGGGPHVRVFSGRTGLELMSFFPFPVGFTGGVRVAAGDLNNDGRADVIAAAGVGGGPHVRAFSGATGGDLMSLFAYETSFSGGVFVAAGPVNGSPGAEVFVGKGPGSDPRARLFSPASVLIAESLVYPQGFAGGATVAVAASGASRLITGAGPGGGPQVRGFTLPAGCP